MHGNQSGARAPITEVTSTRRCLFCVKLRIPATIKMASRNGIDHCVVHDVMFFPKSILGSKPCSTSKNHRALWDECSRGSAAASPESPRATIAKRNRKGRKPVDAKKTTTQAYSLDTLILRLLQQNTLLVPEKSAKSNQSLRPRQSAKRNCNKKNVCHICVWTKAFTGTR
jgi:hypothetical protein